MARLIIEQFPYSSDGAEIVERFIDLPYLVYLDSGKPGSEQGRFDLIAADPISTAYSDGDSTFVQTGKRIEKSSEDPFRTLNSLLQSLNTAPDTDIANLDILKDIPFVGGIIGIFSYELGRQIEVLPNRHPEETEIPQMVAGLYLWSIILDHEKHQCWLVAQPETPPTVLNDVKTRIKQHNASSIDRFSLTSSFSSNLSRTAYKSAFDQIQKYIHAGDCYQVNLSQKLSASCQGSSWEAYKKIRACDNSPFSAYFDTGSAQILSFSPERFIHIEDNRVQTKPIKGTRKKGSSTEENKRIIDELRNSSKDLAENLMIVDLLRNDLGKNCTPGSIAVENLFKIESFSNVHHLVSTINGQLDPECSPMELFRGCFPGGSITGAPKIRAMEIIEELEPNHRSIYCGSIGYLSADGRMDTNIAIRTLLRKDDMIYCSGGGGIVADSLWEKEYQESIDKIEHLMEALKQ